MKIICSAVVLTLVLSACGGGGGDSPSVTFDKDAQAQTEASPSALARLSGRLIINERPNAATIMDLQRGHLRTLPSSGLNGADDYWTSSFGGKYLVQWSVSDWLTRTPVIVYDGQLNRVWSVQLNGLLKGIKRPQLSPDGRFILGIRRDLDRNDVLTLFDAHTGEIVKERSLLDGTLINGAAPVSWLPDGRYVYMVADQVVLASPTVDDDTVQGTVQLPSNGSTEQEILAGASEVIASPDGKRIAFTWQEHNGLNLDTHVWMLTLDGSGLRRLTQVPLQNAPYGFSYDSPSWSPDGKWLSISLHMGGETAGLVYVEEPFLGGRVIGTTGCARSPVYVIPADANNLIMTWPRQDPLYGLKVANNDGVGGKWLTTCGTTSWVP